MDGNSIATESPDTLARMIERGDIPSLLELLSMCTALLPLFDELHGTGRAMRVLRPEFLERDAGGSAFRVLAVFADTAEAPSYASDLWRAPEQTRGPGDRRSDVWRMGAMLYVALARGGQKTLPRLPDLLDALRTDCAAPLKAYRSDLPTAVVEKLRGALHTNADRRPPTMHAFLKELNAVAQTPARFERTDTLVGFRLPPEILALQSPPPSPAPTPAPSIRADEEMEASPPPPSEHEILHDEPPPAPKRLGVGGILARGVFALGVLTAMAALGLATLRARPPEASAPPPEVTRVAPPPVTTATQAILPAPAPEPPVAAPTRRQRSGRRSPRSLAARTSAPSRPLQSAATRGVSGRPARPLR